MENSLYLVKLKRSFFFKIKYKRLLLLSRDKKLSIVNSLYSDLGLSTRFGRILKKVRRDNLFLKWCTSGILSSCGFEYFHILWYFSRVKFVPRLRLISLNSYIKGFVITLAKRNNFFKFIPRISVQTENQRLKLKPFYSQLLMRKQRFVL